MSGKKSYTGATEVTRGLEGSLGKGDLHYIQDTRAQFQDLVGGIEKTHSLVEILHCQVGREVRLRFQRLRLRDDL
jgi:hypothetical protein